MRHKERRLFQKNKIGFLLMLVFIILNTVFSIYTLNSMTQDYYLGTFTMQTIVLLLFGFLTAVKIQTYSSVWWCFAAVVMGLYQGSRVFFTQTLMEGSQLFLFNIILIVSAGFCIAGGILSAKWTKERQTIEIEQEQM
jgi:hypothetical protein